MGSRFEMLWQFSIPKISYELKCSTYVEDDITPSNHHNDLGIPEMNKTLRHRKNIP